MKDRVNEFRWERDTVWRFMGDSGYRPSANEWIPLRTLHETYLVQHFQDDVSIRDFSRRLRDLDYEVKEAPTKDHPMAVFATLSAE